jgi:Archaeal fructose-1,6-bisphosphatase and related enzymes of inositol monophosphatase family
VHPLVNIATSATRAAGRLILRHLDRVDQLRVSKKARNDFVSEVDRGAEAEIVRIIRRAYPDHAILAEEGGAQGESEVQWIIDPLDGTTNFLHRIPHFGVSIGIKVRGRLEHGVIYAPCTNDLYVATRGSGALLNDRRIRVSGCSDLDSALVGTGVPINGENLDAYLPMLREVVNHTAGVRRPGAACLDLAYVAAGRFDAFWEMFLKPWDIAAGIVLVQEAGGIVTELFGEDDPLATGRVLAATPKLHAFFAERLAALQPKSVA